MDNFVGLSVLSTRLFGDGKESVTWHESVRELHDSIGVSTPEPGGAAAAAVVAVGEGEEEGEDAGLLEAQGVAA